MSEFEKYCGKSTGELYYVCFRNDDGLSTKQIYEIFSVFGQIRYINSTGVKQGCCGHRFVTYKSKEETLRCVKGLQRHPSVRLLPFIGKKDKEIGSTEANGSGDEPVEFAVTKRYVGASHCDDNLEFVYDPWSKSSVRIYENQISNVRSSTPNEDPPSLIATDSAARERIDSSSNVRDLPSLVTADSARKHIGQTIVAEDVVVANIHPNLGVSDIKRLFHDYSPVHVSDITMVPECGVRYCHVYLRTVNDAMDAEEILDDLKILGCNMVVLRADRLAEEAGII